VIDADDWEPEPTQPDEQLGPALPDEFWDERTELKRLRCVAHHRKVSAPSVLLSTLCRAVSHIDPDVTLPAIVGEIASLNLFGLQVAPSGAGKSAAHDVAMSTRSMEVAGGIDVGHRAPGSGEGLSERFLGMVSETVNGKAVRRKRQVFRAMHYHLDEGAALADLGNRKGSTLLTQLRTAWVGGRLGMANASDDTDRDLPPHCYRLCFTLGVQAKHAGPILEQAGAGTPQRFVWASAIDRTLPRTVAELPKWPGPFIWTVPHWEAGPIMVAPTVWAEIGQRHLDRVHGSDADELDSHRDLQRLKVAFGFALLNDRYDVNTDDWRLAGVYMTYSDQVRAEAIATVATLRRQEEDARNLRAIRTQRALHQDLEELALGRATRAISRAVHRHSDNGEHDTPGCPRRCATLAVQGKDRALVDLDLAVSAALGQGWVTSHAGRLLPGRKRP
jgi:hypothetical protein